MSLEQENPEGIKEKLNKIAEVIVPGLKSHRLKTEELRRNLESAYLSLGVDYFRMNIEQVQNVLQAELNALQFGLSRDKFHLKEKSLESAIKLDTRRGRSAATTFFYVKADDLRDLALELQVTRPEEAFEYARRAKACDAARTFIYSMPLYGICQ